MSRRTPAVAAGAGRGSSPPSSPRSPPAGLTTDAATKALTNVGLALGTVGRRFDDRATLNTVIDWAPKGDQPKRTKVDIIVSAGPRRVPNDLKGKSFADAQAELKALGLTALESAGYSDDVQDGRGW